MSEALRRPLQLALCLLGICALVFAIYLPGLEGGFVFDDLPNIVNNTELHVSTLRWADWMTATFSSPSSSLQRPLAMLSFALNHYFTGLDPRPMKLTNIAIHALNAVLAFGMLRALMAAQELPGTPTRERRRFAALFAAGAWAVHPINLMAVLFVVQRMESLCHSFVLVGLWLYVSGRAQQMRGGGGWSGWLRILAGLVPCTLLGLLVKESAVLLPLYAWCIEICLLRFRSAGRRDPMLLKAMYVAGLAVPLLLGGVLGLRAALAPDAFDSRNFGLLERLMTEARVVMDYLRWCLFPDLGQLALYHDDYRISRGLLDPATTLVALLGLLALVPGALWLRTRRPLVALGLLWFLGAQLLTATVIPLEIMFEHRNYFASLGICLVLADLLLLLPRTRVRVGAAAAALILLLFAAGTWLRAREWAHPVLFVQSEVAKHPQSPRATYELARMLVILSDYRVESRYYAPAIAAIERAASVPGSSALPEQAALIVAARAHQPLKDAWWEGLDHKLRTQKISRQALGAMAALVECANSRLCQFPPDRMLEMFDAAAGHGDNAELYNVYGSYVLNSLGDTELALKLWREAVKEMPGEPQYHINLCRLLIVLGRADEAREQIAALRRIGRLGQYESLALSLEAKLAGAGAPAGNRSR